MIPRFFVTLFSLMGVLLNGAHAAPTSFVERDGISTLSTDQVGPYISPFLVWGFIDR